MINNFLENLQRTAGVQAIVLVGYNGDNGKVSKSKYVMIFS